jgi:fructose-specific component phosphotransferase system IIB-like protein
MYGHLHIGGRSVQLINTTAGANNAVVCESVSRYGTQPGVVGNEKGFLVDISRCYFDPPLRLSGAFSNSGSAETVPPTSRSSESLHSTTIAHFCRQPLGQVQGLDMIIQQPMECCIPKFLSLPNP